MLLNFESIYSNHTNVVIESSIVLVSGVLIVPACGFFIVPPDSYRREKYIASFLYGVVFSAKKENLLTFSANFLQRSVRVDFC
jgi:hypothetical protein